MAARLPRTACRSQLGAARHGESACARGKARTAHSAGTRRAFLERAAVYARRIAARALRLQSRAARVYFPP